MCRCLHNTGHSRSRKTGQGWGERKWEQSAHPALPKKDGAGCTETCRGVCWEPQPPRASSPGLPTGPAGSAGFHHSPSFLNKIWKHRHDILYLLRDGPLPCAGTVGCSGPGAGGPRSQRVQGPSWKGIYCVLCVSMAFWFVRHQ